MTNKCPYCKKELIVPAWRFCDQKGCLIANTRKHSEKAKKRKEESLRLEAEYDKERTSSLVPRKSKKSGTASMG